MKSIVAILSILIWAAAGCAKKAEAPVVGQSEASPPGAQTSNEKNRLPAEVEAFFKDASTMELFALDPNKLPSGASTPVQETLHGYRITGRASLSDASQRKALAELVLRGIRESDGSQAKCFQPRHAIRVEQNATVLELVICYECLSIEAFGNVFGAGAEPRVVLTSEAVEPAVTKAFGEVGLKIAAR